MSAKRKLSSAALFGIAVGTLLAAMLLTRLARNLPAAAGLAADVLAIALVGLSLVAIALHWRRLDEAAREAHKAAWYWGGSLGLGAAGGLLGVMLARPDFELSAYAVRPGDTGMFVTGAFAVLAAQFVGYIVAWLWWWWSRR